MTDSSSTAPEGSSSLLRAIGLRKCFGTLVANDDVHLDLRAGEIHAVVGENGAGKTTLMRMLSGEIQPDSGCIEIDATEVRLRGPQDAVLAGVGMVHQRYSVVAEFSLLDNLLLASPGASARRLTRDQLSTAVAYLEGEGFTAPARTLVKDLSIDELQRFEIARLLYVGARILILDEPTAVLGPIEIDSLYRKLRALADEGRAVVVITHKLGEVESHANRVTVMRAGKTVLSTESGFSKADLLPAMFGDHTAVARDQAELTSHHADHVMGDQVLEVSGLTVLGHDGRPRVEDVAFSVRAGEVLCVVGVEGNGQVQLMDSLAGLRQADGAVRVLGEDVSGMGPRDRFHRGVRFVSEDRHRWDVLSGATIAENLMAHDYADGRAFGHTNAHGKTALAVITEALTRFDVRPLAPRMRLGNLSGGNQQRAVVARESTGDKRLLLMSHPTRGLDVVGASRIVDDALNQRARGVAIVWNTADLDEAFAVADTFLVMFRGRVAYLGRREDTSLERLALAMSGAEEAR